MVTVRTYLIPSSETSRTTERWVSCRGRLRQDDTLTTQGDGVTDDTVALNNAMFDGYRCSYETNCSSQTTTPAIVYFPAGTYLISTPIIMPYYTQAVGDANDLPIIRGTSTFFGIGLFDSDPYLPYAVSWFQNQNNFWRHVRNFVIDMTLMPTNGQVNGIHWQVAQGTSLQNIVINMAENVPNNTQIVCTLTCIV